MRSRLILLLFALALAPACEDTAATGQAGGADADASGDVSGSPDAPGAPEPELVVDPVCDEEAPHAPVLPVVPVGTTLVFEAPSDDAIEVGTGTPSDIAPEVWTQQDSLRLDDPGRVKVFARLVGGTCAAFRHVYEVAEAYPPAAGQPGSQAIAADDPAILRWARGYSEVVWGTGLIEKWKDPTKALGPAEGTVLDVVSLGNGGTITLTFDGLISDQAGLDLVVFENAVNDTFLELAFVEVSSDGEIFARFDSGYLGTEPVEQYGTQPSEGVGGLAGKYRRGFGIAYDLIWLHSHPDVQAGRVDLDAISHVRIVDIIGDGSMLDSFGQPIYDPTPTIESGGFDLDAVGVLH